MSEDNHTCVFCGTMFFLRNDTYANTNLEFDNYLIKDWHSGYIPTTNGGSSNSFNPKEHPNAIKLIMIKCPNCKKTQIIIQYYGSQFDGVKNREIKVFPGSSHKNYPDYVPQYIRNDYEEACSILNLSPKSSSTLARRVLEEILMDFYKTKKNRLIDKIKELETKDVDPDVINELHALRQVGNVGAHLELDSNNIPEDVTTDEATALILVIEDIIDDTYIKRHNQQNNMEKVNNIAKRFKKGRK